MSASLKPALAASITLFSRTFNRIPSINQSAELLMAKIKGSRDQYVINQAARLLYLKKLINTQTAELQSETTLNVIKHFDQSYESMHYDYDNKRFCLSRMSQSPGHPIPTKFTFYVEAIDLQIFDHPFRRQTLYFHELKDIQKYVNIQYKPGLPKFWKNFQRQSTQNQLIDKKNPLGVPLHSKPLRVKIEAQKSTVKTVFHLQYHLGNITLKKGLNHKTGYDYSIDPMQLDQNIQKMLFLFMKKRAGLVEEEFQQMSKLAFVGGRVLKLQLAMDWIQEISQRIPKP